MNSKLKETIKMLTYLPDAELDLAYEFIKKLIITWDPDFTKIAPKEQKQIDKAIRSGFNDEDIINWK